MNTMTILVIVESPSKCKKIEEYLGPAYKVVASCGHITSFQSLEQFNPTTYEIQYKVEKPKIVSMLKSEIRKAEQVILATDDDREGEAIAWHICKVCRLNIETTPRLLFNEITKEAIQNGLKQLTQLNQNRIHSQQTRQLLDLYIGFTISPKLWTYISNKLSAGRCQTPALHMLYQKELDYRTQSSNTRYKVTGLFTSKNIKFHLSAHLTASEPKPFLEACQEFVFQIDTCETRKCTYYRPKILITSTLQQYAHQRFGFSPAKTMSYAQVLYENGLITYMRTDTPTYNDSFKSNLEKYIVHKYGPAYYKEIPATVKKAHEGIRVTNLNTEFVTFDTKQINALYHFIYIHTLQTSMSDCQMEITEFTMNAPLKYAFQYKHPQVSFDGWKRACSKGSETDVADYNLYLRQLKEIRRQSITCKEESADPVYHYCESQLIQRLEREQIGRPSTYATILNKLYDKHYITKGTIRGEPVERTTHELTDKGMACRCEPFIMEETNKISVTDIGKKVAEFCYRYYDHLFEYKYTSIMETRLDEIEQHGQWKDIFTEFKQAVDKPVVVEACERVHTSVFCGVYKKHNVRLRKGPFGYYSEWNKKNNSLTGWEHHDRIPAFIESQVFPPDLLQSLMDFNVDFSVRSGKYGDYVYYKTSAMKKPQFYALDIKSRDINDIKDYIQKKYNLTL